jgi:hypothetical protein
MKTKICAMPNCINELTENARSTFCVNCRASCGRWSRRRPAEILERRPKLHLYDARMEELPGQSAFVMVKCK